MLNIKAFLVKLFGLIFHSSVSKEEQEELILCGLPGVWGKFKSSLALYSLTELPKSTAVDPHFPNTEEEVTY